jgi:hypothetical protein
MPAATPRPVLAAARLCARCLVTVAVWTAWLALVLLICVQTYIACVNELQVPAFLLRAIESHLAESGVSVTFGRATFDPSGRVLLQKASFKLESFAEPVMTAEAIYIRLDPWALIGRRFEAREVRATGANLFIPAMLSASGRAEKIVQDLDAGFSITSRGDEFSMDYLTCRLGGVFVSAHGAVNSGTIKRNGAREAGAPPALPLAEFMSTNYVALSREFSRAEEQLAGLENTIVTAELVPSDTRGAIVRASVFADGLRMPGPVAVVAGRIHAAFRFPLLGGTPIMTSALATAETLNIGGKVDATGVRARIRGILKMDPSAPRDALSFTPSLFELTAGSVSAEGSSLGAPLVNITPDGGSTYTAEISTMLYGLPIWARGDVDLAAKSADVSFDGSLSPGLLVPLSERLKIDLRRFADLSQPLLAAGRIRFSKGWKFEDVSARVDVRDFTAYKVKFDEARGFVTFDGTHFAAHDATAVSGDYLAQGSYEQNFSTLQFRYLLTGRLRPLYISPWFGGDWWPGIFSSFAFPDRPPDASIDVRGQYLHGRDFAVYGYADARNPVVKGVPLDRLRTLLYVDQFACDGLEIAATRAGGSAMASFRLTTEPVQGTWSGLDIDLTSRIDPAPFGPLLPPDGAAAIAAFSFGQPPELAMRGHFDGPAAMGTQHKTLHTEARASTPLRIHGVAFDRAAFKFDLNDDAVDVTGIDAGFAGGTLSGSAQLTGSGDARRIRLKASLDGASLGQAAGGAEGYVVADAAGISTARGTFAKDKSGVRLDLNVSAEGRPADLATFTGDGNVQIQGAKLGEISLLGGLSKVLKFPELRFTQARASFRIENAALNFPDLSVIGANSAIRAKGTYAIDRRMLDFSVTIYPFMESKSLLQIFNAISAPLSAVLRVRLTGTIDKPAWRLAYSPLNLLRADDVKLGVPEKQAVPSPLANPSP